MANFGSTDGFQSRLPLRLRSLAQRPRSWSRCICKQAPQGNTPEIANLLEKEFQADPVKEAIGELECLQKIGNFVWKTHVLPHLSTVRGISSLVEFLLKRIVQSADGGEFDPAWKAVVGIHVCTGEPGRTDYEQVSNLITRQFREYSETFADHTSLPPCVLVTEAIQRLLWHRFSFEPVGEFARLGNEDSTVVFRVWASIEPREIIHPVQRIVDAAISEPKRPIIPISVPHATCEQDVVDVARALLIHLEDSANTPTLILHWQCTKDRFRDLLRPIDECIGVLARLNRRSSFKDSREDYQVDVEKGSP